MNLPCPQDCLQDSHSFFFFGCCCQNVIAVTRFLNVQVWKLTMPFSFCHLVKIFVALLINLYWEKGKRNLMQINHIYIIFLLDCIFFLGICAKFLLTFYFFWQKVNANQPLNFLFLSILASFPPYVHSPIANGFSLFNLSFMVSGYSRGC